MRNLISLLFASLLVLSVSISFAGDAVVHGTIGIGGHMTSINDYYQKAGEFNLGKDDPYPEFTIDLSVNDGVRNFDISGYYFDEETMALNLSGYAGGMFKFDVSYSSFYRNTGNDQLENLEVRESTSRDGSTLGGKIITHENHDPLANYGYTREEIKTALSTDVPFGGDRILKLKIAHKSILENGEEQGISTMHCASCHIQGETVEVDREIHNISFDAETVLSDIEVGAGIDYRTSNSDAAAPSILYDLAQHPVNGGAIPEFGSRLNYDNEFVTYSRIPRTDRVALKLNAKTDLGNGTLSGAFTTASSNNKYTEISTSSNGGVLKYAFKLSSKANAVAGFSMSKTKSDDYFVDLAPWRDGRNGGGMDFDYDRYSNLDRTKALYSLNMKYRASNKAKFYLYAGLDQTKRDNYPVFENKDNEKKIFAELKMKYKMSKKFGFNFKYGIDMIDNPFATVGQLLEKRGAEVLEPLPGFAYPFYFQRDALRYGDATTQPTQSHKIDASFKVKTGKIILTAGGKITLDKNDDLVEYEFERTTIQPTASFTLLGSNSWSFFASASMFNQTANGPVAVALFDG